MPFTPDTPDSDKTPLDVARDCAKSGEFQKAQMFAQIAIAESLGKCGADLRRLTRKIIHTAPSAAGSITIIAQPGDSSNNIVTAVLEQINREVGRSVKGSKESPDVSALEPFLRRVEEARLAVNAEVELLNLQKRAGLYAGLEEQNYRAAAEEYRRALRAYFQAKFPPQTSVESGVVETVEAGTTGDVKLFALRKQCLEAKQSVSAYINYFNSFAAPEAHPNQRDLTLFFDAVGRYRDAEKAFSDHFQPM